MPPLGWPLSDLASVDATFNDMPIRSRYAGVAGSGLEYPELLSTSQETVAVSEYYAGSGNTANSPIEQASDEKNSLELEVKTSQDKYFSVEAELSSK